MEGLTVGRMVHYVIPEDCALVDADGNRMGGQHCAAIVVGVHDGLANLHTLHNNHSGGFRKDVPYSAEAEPGTWHWIERA